MIDWHRLFGLALIDFFTDAPFVVELEKDLSLKQQLLDVVILRKGEEEFSEKLPDGLDNLATHNLLSYKSLREPLDDWTLDELIGYYVNYRKQTSPSLNDLLPTERFRFYGIATRFPQKLASLVHLEQLREGVYQVIWGTQKIRVLVLSEIPQSEHNAIWNLFSAMQRKVASGAQQYRKHTTEMSSIINQLFLNYQLEGLIMPYTMEDYRRDTALEYIKSLTPEELKKQLSLDELLQQLSLDERLQGLSADERLRGLSLEDIKAYLERQEKK